MKFRKHFLINSDLNSSFHLNNEKLKFILFACFSVPPCVCLINFIFHSSMSLNPHNFWKINLCFDGCVFLVCMSFFGRIDDFLEKEQLLKTFIIIYLEFLIMWFSKTTHFKVLYTNLYQLVTIFYDRNPYMKEHQGVVFVPSLN